MKLYLLSQDENTDCDTYDSCIVCAESEEDAKSITPCDEVFVEIQKKYPNWAYSKTSIMCEEIGEANKNQKRGVILASFNAC